MKIFQQKLTLLLETIICACFILFFIMILLLAALRYLSLPSISGGNEIITILFVYTTSLGSAIAVGQKGHIAINILSEKVGQRIANILSKVQLVLVASVIIAITWYSFSWISETGDNLMPTLGASRTVIQASIPLGCGLAVLYCITASFVGPEPSIDLNTGNQKNCHPSKQ